MTVDIGSGEGGGPDLNTLVIAIDAQGIIMKALTTSIGALVTKMDSLSKGSGKAQKASQTADHAAAAQDEGHNRMSEMDSLRKLRRTTARHMTKVNDGRSVTIAALDKLRSFQDRASRILTRAVEGGEIGKFGTIAESLEFEMNKLSKAFQKKKQKIENVIKSQEKDKKVGELTKLREEQKLLYDQYTDGRIATTSTLDAFEKFDRKIKKIVDTLNKSGFSSKFKTDTKKTDHIKDIISEQKSDKQTTKQDNASKKAEKDKNNTLLKYLNSLNQLEKKSNLLLKRKNKEGEITRTLVYTFEDLDNKMQELKDNIQGLMPKSNFKFSKSDNLSIIKKSYENQENNKEEQIFSLDKLIAEQNLLFERSKNLKNITNALVYTFEDLDKKIQEAAFGLPSDIVNQKRPDNTSSIKQLQKKQNENKKTETQTRLENKLQEANDKFGTLYNRLKDGRIITEALTDKLANLFKKMDEASVKAGYVSTGKGQKDVNEIKLLREKQIKEGKTSKESELKSRIQSLIDSFKLAFKSINDGSKITKSSIESLRKKSEKIVNISNPLMEKSSDPDKINNALSKAIGTIIKARDLQVKTKKEEDKKKKQYGTENAFKKEYDSWMRFKNQIAMQGGTFKLASNAAAGYILDLKKFEETARNRRWGPGKGRQLQGPMFADLAKTLQDAFAVSMEPKLAKQEKAKSEKDPKETFLQSARKQVNPATLGISVLQTALSSMTGAITGIAGALLGSPIVSVITALLAPFQSLMSTVGKAITVIFNWIMIVNGLTGFLKRLELQIDSFTARWQLSNDIMLSLDTAVQRASTGIATSMANLGSDVVGAVDNILSNPLTGLLDIVDKISKFVGLVNPGLMDRYNKVLENLMALIGSALQPVVSEITSLLYIFGTQLKPVIGMIGGQLAVAVRTFAMALIPIIPQLISGLLALAKTLIGFVADIGVKLAVTGSELYANLQASEEEKAQAKTKPRNAMGQEMEPFADWIDDQGFSRFGEKPENIKPLTPKTNSEDFMDSAIARNAKFSSGMDMGKSSVQKAFEASSSYGEDPSDKQTLDAAQAEFFSNPAAWVKKAMAGMENKPRQQVGGNVGGQAGGPNKMQAAMMLMQMGQVVAGAPAAALRDLHVIT